MPLSEVPDVLTRHFQVGPDQALELEIDSAGALETVGQLPDVVNYRLVVAATPPEPEVAPPLGGFLTPPPLPALEGFKPLADGEQPFVISVSAVANGHASFTRRAYNVKESATLAEVEALIRTERGIDDQPLAFFVTDVTTGVDVYQPDTLVIGDVGISDRRPLTLRPPEPGEVPSAAEAVSPLEEVGVMVSTLRPTAKPPKAFNFVVPQRKNEEFQIELLAGATVLDARKAVAQRCGVQYDDIGLLFLGKLLKDEFILERMRIGEKVITVTVNDKRTVILKTRLTVIRR
jgi:hypothetical protein